MAKRWEAETPKGAKLPARVKHKRKPGDLYNKKCKKVSMEKGEFKSEHRHLVKVLKHGNKKQRLSEAKEQRAELSKYKRIVNNKLKGSFGVTDLKKHTITVNKKLHKKLKEKLGDTIVHETMHAKHPHMLEKTIRRRTPKVLKRMSKKQKKRMYSKFR